MSFICDFPPFFKNKSPLEFDTNNSLDLESTNKSQTLNISNTLPKYVNENEIKFNLSEQKNVQYIKPASTFDLILQISGTTILQNLIITAKANNHKGDPTPIKCQWRRYKSETERKNIKNINSLSYMPNSQDIGYYIEVEVESLDNTGDISIARYGPISIDKEAEIIIEEMINYEKKCFNLVLTNDKIKNKNFIIELGKKEIKLYNIDQKGKKNISERCKYSLVNPYLELNNSNVNKFTISFAQLNNSESNNHINNNSDSNSNSNNLSFYTEVENSDICSSDIKIKKEYEFYTKNKQTRELIYIIIQYNLLNIKLRNCKIFRAVNYNVIPAEVKIGILKLIDDLKIQKEQNVLLQKNIKYLEYVNGQLNEECNTLEENCKVTMDKINGREPNLDQGLGTSNGNFYKNNNLSLKNLKTSEEEWKYKVNELKKNYNSLMAKQKAINEEKIILTNKDNNNFKLIAKNEEEIKDIKEKNNKFENEIKNNNKNLFILNNDKLKLKQNIEDIEQQLKSIQDRNTSLKNEIKNENEISNQKIKNEINEIKQNNENLNYENKNLIMQKEMLSKKKNDLIQEIENLRKEKEELINNKQKNKKKNENNLIENLQKENESLQNDYEKIKDDYQMLILENINLKEAYEKEKKTQNQNKVNMSTISNNTIYQISPEEYEEYENLRRNRDENEVVIMQLKNRSDTLELEIKELKNKINKLKSKKKKS